MPAQDAPQQSQPITPPAPAQTCVIEGQVVRAGDTMPLKKAVVMLMPMNPAATAPPSGAGGRTVLRPMNTITNEDGRFCFAAADPGQYQIAALRSGYVRQAYGQRAPNQPGTPLTLADGQQISGITFRMIQNAVITGKVLDEDGEPVPGVRIQVLKWRYRNGRKMLAPVGPGNSTNDLGEYRVFGLGPGKYYVSAAAGNGMSFPAEYGTWIVGGGVTGRGGNQNAYPPVFFPNTLDPAHASAIAVQGGEEIAGIDFRLLPVRGVRLWGRVVMPAGHKFAMTLTLNSREALGIPGPSKFATVGADGSFEMEGVPPGSYTLLGFDEDGDAQYRVEEPVEVGSEDVEVTAALHTAADLAGRVIVEGDQLTPASARTPHFNVLLQHADLGQGGGGAQVQPDLSFKVKNIVNGDYIVNLYGLSDDQYVRSVRLDGRETNGMIRLRGRGLLEVIVSANGARLEGTVVDGNHQPFARAHVVLVPAEEERRSPPNAFKAALADASGHYSLRGIAPGSYKLFAWDNIEDAAYEDPEWLRAYEASGVLVRIDEGGRLTQELTVIAAAADAGQ